VGKDEASARRFTMNQQAGPKSAVSCRKGEGTGMRVAIDLPNGSATRRVSSSLEFDSY